MYSCKYTSKESFFMKKERKYNFSFIIISFVFLIGFLILIFASMNRRVKELNEDTVRDIGFMYLSSIGTESVNHSKTYFSSKFESMEQLIDAVVKMGLDEESSKQYIQNEVTNDAVSVSLLTKDGKREFLRGDETIHPLDDEKFNEYVNTGEDKVILSVDDSGNRIIEIVKFLDFKIGDNEYCAFMYGVDPDTINNMLGLFHNENMVYSFVIRKTDGAFVIKNEDAQRDTYFERIKAMYDDYEGMTAQDYIDEISQAMAEDKEYSKSFLLNGELRMLFAQPFAYSDWYIITFMTYNEMEGLLEQNHEQIGNVFSQYMSILFIVFAVVFACYVVYSYRQIQKQQKLKNEAISANKSKSEFLSNMSHDIRTPMNAIIGMTDIARSHIDDKEKVDICLQKITRSSHHLLSLINDVLDMSKIESGKMTLSIVQISFRESIENIVSVIQPQMNSKHHNFDIYINNIISENVYCDSLRLNQILINLLSNAVKYTPSGGVISLSLSQEESPRGKDYVRNHIIVKDNGIGMTEDFIKVIFDNFVREDKKRVSKEEGTGLGMAITKHIIDVMEGTIDIKSKPNEGSEFHVTLDLKKGDADIHDMNLNGVKVLVADDDKELCLSVMQSLEEIGTEAEYVTDGLQAVEAIKNNPDKFDVILVDWRMPDMNGVETAKKIREYTKADIPVILISAYDLNEIEEEARNAGINGFIPKPLFKSTLFYGIKRHMENTPEIEENKEKTVKFNGERILLAEDNELNSEIAIDILTEAGLVVDWAENGKLCVEKFCNSEPGYYNAILMDIRMPIMDGYEATKNIRTSGRSDTDIPIIAMTADAFAEDIEKAKECGMNGHIAKPIDVNSLFYILRKGLKK